MSYPAESYENFMVPSLFRLWSTYLVHSANIQPGECVLDVACGTGIVARQVAPLVGSQKTVIGLDRNQDMIDMAQVAAKREGLVIEWHKGPAEQLPFADSSFDLVLCQFGLMFFSDRHAALTEMRRVLRTSGRVVLSVWQGLDHHPFYQTLHNVSLRHLGKSGVEEVFSLGNAEELRGLLTDAGFSPVEIKPASITAHFQNPGEFLDWEIDVDPSETPALKHLDAKAQKAIMDAVRQDMQAPLRAVMQDNQVALPFHAHIAHAGRGG